MTELCNSSIASGVRVIEHLENFGWFGKDIMEKMISGLKSVSVTPEGLCSAEDSAAVANTADPGLAVWTAAGVAVLYGVS